MNLMMQLLRAEALRFARNRVNLYVLAAFGLLLVVSAVWAGLAARDYRAQVQAQAQHWGQVTDAARDAAAAASNAAPDGAKNALAAFTLGRSDHAIARLPASGGLVLSVRQFERLSPELRVSVESRHADARKNDVLANPLLDGLGVPDFATVLALLLPLALIGLCYGLVQEDREQGIWRLVCTQCASLGSLLGAALLIRAGAVVGVAVLASALAFLLDPGATLASFAAWIGCLLVYTLVWTAIAGLCALPAWSSGAAAIGMLGIWLAVSFMTPAALAWVANTKDPMPSRLDAIVAMRVAQQDAEVATDDLVSAWYRDHPQDRNPAYTSHTWPVTFVPRFLAQDQVVRPLMRSFDDVRARQLETMEGWSFLSPGLALVMGADRLAGIDASRYLRYVDAVNRHEDAWRAFLVPRIMGYRGLSVDDMARLPRFDPASISDPPALNALWRLAGLGLVLLGVAVAGRRRLRRP